MIDIIILVYIATFLFVLVGYLVTIHDIKELEKEKRKIIMRYNALVDSFNYQKEYAEKLKKEVEILKKRK